MESRLLARLTAYTPGEQPRDKKYIKLNTNENPYPPCPKIQKKKINAEDFRLYPDPDCRVLKEALADTLRVPPSHIFTGNGSDEVLRLATDVFVRNAAHIGIFDPTYSLYPVLADIREAPLDVFPLPQSDEALCAFRFPDPRPDLFFLVNPNAPTGTMFGLEAVRALARTLAPSILIVDEAYALFSGTDCMRLAFEEPNVLISRTFSKAWSLAGLRVGILVGDEALISNLYKVKDSYNVDVLAQTIAEAALSDPGWMEENCRKIVATRERFSAALTEKGWKVTPSHTNFVWCVPPPPLTGRAVLEKLRTRGILIRHFSAKPLERFVRITIGTDEQMDEILSLV